MCTVSELLKVLGGFVAFFLFVVGVTILTRPTPPPPGIITERWYDDQYVGGQEFRVKARTYFRCKKGDWYEGEK